MARTLLGRGNAPEAVLRALHDRARRLALPPPAALSGRWFGVRAVLAPSLAVEMVPTDQFMTANRPAPNTYSEGLAIGGGWIGSVQYPAHADAPLLTQAGWTDEVLIFDGSHWWHETLSAQSRADDYRYLFINSASRIPSGQARPWRIQWATPDRRRHRENVLACLNAIRCGEIYQACIGTNYTGQLRGRAVDVYCDAVTTTGPARAAYFEGPAGTVVSLSPELFLRRRGCLVTSSPIKGTAPKTASPEKLARSEKDIAENVMITDLVRNDLGKLAETGSVRVTNLLEIVAAPAVWHLVSTIEAHLDPDMPNSALIAATFPPASVTGTPKRRAQQLIASWEQQPRGHYCGAIGMASPIAGMELNVAIRTIEFASDGGCRLGVGGGITIDSDPDAEWDECVIKGSSIVNL
ncbi:aminodeoxychorismate synthase component I [Mycobacterium aquaticum]|uniref:Chorismate-utilising enzyme C-terminal domain-containing protein n=1 Tax=Mycobacterium aquaticum TaxID=1927124 RepID=A0A1X0BA85_9MYCO|nr:aminodeoxychorismate synthase component I [Mycobacterium aquaticum]ORA39230.1 hypothetical protein BST13_02910 [Mycobacterium aquaticum]